MTQHTINIAPAPHVVQTALKDAGIPLQYNDDHTVTISNAGSSAGIGWDSNGNVTIPEDHNLYEILKATITMAMERYFERTMVIPSNIMAINEVADELVNLRHAGRSEDSEWIDEMIERLHSVATNLEPR